MLLFQVVVNGVDTNGSDVALYSRLVLQVVLVLMPLLKVLGHGLLPILQHLVELGTRVHHDVSFELLHFFHGLDLLNR